MNELYNNAKIFHFRDKLASLATGRLTSPIHIRLKPTNRCNHRCGYCCYRNKSLFLSELMHERDEIPHEKMEEIIADLGRMGVKAVTFSGGGEPLCYPHIVESIRGLLAQRVKVALLTNGALLAGDVAELLAEHGAWVRVSMDAADPESYARARGVGPREFARVCENVRRFAGTPARKCVLGLNLIVTRENSGSVRAFLEQAKDMGADHVKVSGAVVSTRPDENTAYLAPFFEAVKQQIREAAARLSDARFSVVDKFHMPVSALEAYERAYTRCPFAQCLAVIAADQNVYTCQDKAYTRSGLLGSIRTCSFRELWNSERLHRRLFALDPSRECRHHCVAHAKNLALLDYMEADAEHLDFV